MHYFNITSINVEGSYCHSQHRANTIDEAVDCLRTWVARGLKLHSDYLPVIAAYIFDTRARILYVYKVNANGTIYLTDKNEVHY